MTDEDGIGTAGSKPPAKAGQDDVCIHFNVKSQKTVIDVAQGFDALLKPFYQGKSLTDPIDTAKVR